MADWFLRQYKAIVINDELYIYEGGKYIFGDKVFKEKATAALKKEYQTNRLTEAFNYIKNTVSNVTPDEATHTGEYLNLRNGLLNLSTLEFSPHTPELRTIVQVPVFYDANAKCPAIDAFLNEVAPESVEVIEEMLGYCLLPSMKYEKSFLFHGDGGNGKGTLIAIMQAFFGSENVSNVALQALSENRFYLAELFGKMVNLHADIPNKLIEDTSIFKELTSGDRVQAERKHKPPFNFCNRAKLIFSTNELSSSKDNSEGFHRRWVIIPFKKKFANRELRQRLFSDEELSGLLLKAISGLKRLMEMDKFTEPVCTMELAEEYRKKSDSVYQFLKDYCSFDEESYAGKQELYTAYRTKCCDWGSFPVSQANFNSKVKTIYPGVVEYRKSAPRKWKGIKMEAVEDEFLVDGICQPLTSPVHPLTASGGRL